MPPVPVIRAVGAVGEGQRFRAMSVSQHRQTLGHLIERLIPGEALPMIGAAFPCALQRVIKAVRMIEMIDQKSAPGTKPPARDRMIGIPFYLDRASVLDA